MSSLDIEDKQREFGYASTLCRSCGKSVTFFKEVSLKQCECGAGVMNPSYVVDQSSVRMRPECSVCDDTGFVLIPVSGDMLYSSVARCHCNSGEKLSKDIPICPAEWWDLGAGDKDSMFSGRRQKMLRSMEHLVGGK